MRRKSNNIQNASATAQRAWLRFPPTLQRELRKQLPDQDGDGVPGGFDCRPYDKKRQESFLPDDQKVITSLSQVQIGARPLGKGTNGTVYPIKGNKNLVVKVTHAVDSQATTVEEEYGDYAKYKLLKLPLFIPTKKVTVTGVAGKNKNVTGLLRPVVTPIIEPMVVKNAKLLTDSRLSELRNKIVILSYKGFVFRDGYQIGLDRAGRLLIFDTGLIAQRKISPSNICSIFEQNNIEWQDLASRIGKAGKIGKIARAPELDKKYLPSEMIETINSKQLQKTRAAQAARQKYMGTVTRKSTSSKARINLQSKQGKIKINLKAKPNKI